MLVGVSSQSGVVGFDVEFEMFNQIELTEETDDGHGVVVVLVSGRFFGLGLDQHLSLETNLLFVI